MELPSPSPSQRVTAGAPFAVQAVEANGLLQRVLVFAAEGPGEDAAPPVVLVHGYMDAAGTWSRVAAVLAARGRSVLVPELRGFGGAPRVPAGGYYHFPDYVADLEGTLAALAVPVVDLVGHSMGGAIATYFAAGFPERVRRLAVLEGLGPPDMPIAAAPARLRAWVDATRELRARGAARPMTEEEAFARLRAAHPAVDAEALRSVLPHLVRLDEDGLRWAFDPLHRTPSPSPFLAAYYRALAAAVAAPVLFVSGGPAGYHPPDEEERLAAFRSLTRVELPRGGHMMHWTEPEALGDALASFFAR